jgi:ABC-type oligopeptide transport system substrate-binding subunit
MMKRTTKWIFPVLLAGLLALAACQPANQATESSISPDSMPKTQDVPAIDQNQPDDFATATFSMG